MIDAEPGVYAIMRGSEAILIAQAETGLRNRLRDFEQSAITGEGKNSGGRTFFRKALTFDGLRIEVFALPHGSTENWRVLKDFLIVDYVQRTGRKPLCNTILPSDAKTYLRAS